MSITPRRLVRNALLLSVGVLALALAACNTVKGAGRDIESAGEAGERVINGD